MLHVVVPDGVDDPARPSGGNAYDRRLCAELAALGWEVREYAVHPENRLWGSGFHGIRGVGGARAPAERRLRAP